jgi:Flp pilus assembly pilin Flp
MRVRLGNEAGQTLSEYSVVLAVITIAAVATFSFLSGSIITAIDSAASIVGS